MTKGVQKRAKALVVSDSNIREGFRVEFECDSFAVDVAFCQSGKKHSFWVVFFDSFLFDKRNEYKNNELRYPFKKIRL